MIHHHKMSQHFLVCVQNKQKINHSLLLISFPLSLGKANSNFEHRCFHRGSLSFKKFRGTCSQLPMHHVLAACKAAHTSSQPDPALWYFPQRSSIRSGVCLFAYTGAALLFWNLQTFEKAKLWKSKLFPRFLYLSGDRFQEVAPPHHPALPHFLLLLPSPKSSVAPPPHICLTAEAPSSFTCISGPVAPFLGS